MPQGDPCTQIRLPRSLTGASSAPGLLGGLDAASTALWVRQGSPRDPPRSCRGMGREADAAARAGLQEGGPAALFSTPFTASLPQALLPSSLAAYLCLQALALPPQVRRRP